MVNWALSYHGCETVRADLAAAKCAAGISVLVRGTLGAILPAKTEGRSRAVAPVLDQIRQASVHRLSAVLRALLRLAGVGWISTAEP